MPAILFKPASKPIASSAPTCDYDRLIFSYAAVTKFIKQIDELKSSCEKYKDFDIFPISIKFNKLLGKSLRIKQIFRYENKIQQIWSSYIFENDSITDSINIVYKCDLNGIDATKRMFTDITKKFSEEEFKKFNTMEDTDIKEELVKKGLPKNYFTCLYDILHVENIALHSFDVAKIFSSRFTPITKILNLFSDDEKFKNFLINKKIIDEAQFRKAKILDFTYNFTLDVIKKINETVPFIIASSVKDETITFKKNIPENHDASKIYINKSTGREPVIGVIDSGIKFSDNWSSYVAEQKKLLLPGMNSRYDHGTGVCSLIIGNDEINPNFKDNLGNFRVKLFEVLPDSDSGLSESLLIKLLNEEIIAKNQDIKVWNISIGFEVPDFNSITFLGKQLDDLQEKYDVQFVVSLGNYQYVSPADSLTAISVGSRYLNDQQKYVRCSYSHDVKVLKMYDKPNCQTINNDKSVPDNNINKIKIINEFMNAYYDEGTSFSAPLIARKLAHLIHVEKLSPQLSRSIINYLAYNDKENHFVDLNILNSKRDLFVMFEGEMLAKNSKAGIVYNYETDVKIDVSKLIIPSKNRTATSQIDCSVNYALSYNLAGRSTFGDEYSSTDIGMKLNYLQTNEQGKTKRRSLLSANDNAVTLNSTEKEWRKHHGKYNPSRVVVSDKKIVIPDITPSPTNFTFSLHRIELFDDDSKSIKYGAIFHLFSDNVEAFEDFVSDNEVNIQRVISIGIDTEDEIDIEA